MHAMHRTHPSFFIISSTRCSILLKKNIITLVIVDIEERKKERKKVSLKKSCPTFCQYIAHDIEIKQQ